MNGYLILIAIVVAAIPIAVFVLRESRYRNPAARWPRLAESLSFEYQDAPPRLRGRWKDREVLLTSQGEVSLMCAATRPSGSYRVEAGPKEALEKEAGMVVPDRVALNDTRLAQALLARAFPSEFAPALDLVILNKLAAFPGARILAVPGRVELRLPFSPTEPAHVRQAADIAVSLADAVESA